LASLSSHVMQLDGEFMTLKIRCGIINLMNIDILTLRRFSFTFSFLYNV
jgi:hypothetical protein